MEDRIERSIVIGLIASTEYTRRVLPYINPLLFESPTARLMVKWCLEHYKTYNEAPGRAIETIFVNKVKQGLSEDLAEEIEEDILPSLSTDFVDEGINVDHLVDETRKYLNGVFLQRHQDAVQVLLEQGKIDEAQQLVNLYTPLAFSISASLDLSTEDAVDKLKEAFRENTAPVLKFGGAFGDFINSQMVRGAFVAFQAPEKRGKTFLLLTIALQALRQRKKVVFFQAGDMTEKQMLRRMAIRISTKNTLEKYCGLQYEPVVDCVRNQLDTCQKQERECTFGAFDELDEKKLRAELTIDMLKTAYDMYKDEYRPCRNCTEFKTSKLGSPWVKKLDVGEALTMDEAVQNYKKFFFKYKKSFKLATYPNRTLTVSTIRAELEQWRKVEQWEPDIIIIDYADIMLAEREKEHRHQQNEVWMALRAVSQQGNQPLVITATQADASSYSTDTISKDNFSEDKRKYAHVTAMYGLSMDKKGREKAIGIMRINDLVVREGEGSQEVHILQNLRRGLAYLGSYY